ncbi:Dimeric alpha+beta barrel [Glarea lozoyensis ATCC 20868]|uniref:Dimeric alpha+beta barrel n=1 Tax=Glarea lozoyensis (strain ATCC 20868 / MF5171) TaxID=1116229 RepID=S3DU58_GLAL2|nr:Dimeric alpha+beta barrel [Glarea lozoyensis ATCC 20868]EPE29943.1 Dimeric alpha+beta barrel [Glarea lozoyensis ATCC 20868]
MVYTVTVFLWRKPGISPSQFRNHYETVHIPLLRTKVGSSFPLTHSRHYLTRTPNSLGSSDNSNDNHKPTILGGKPEDFDWDVYSEMVFQDYEHFGVFAQKMGEISDGKDEEWKVDCEAFLDMDKIASRMVIVDEAVVTKRE